MAKKSAQSRRHRIKRGRTRLTNEQVLNVHLESIFPPADDQRLMFDDHRVVLLLLVLLAPKCS